MPPRNAATAIKLSDPPSVCHVQGELLNNAIHGAAAVRRVRLPSPEALTLKVRPRISLLKLSGLPCRWRMGNGVGNTST